MPRIGKRPGVGSAKAPKAPKPSKPEKTRTAVVKSCCGAKRGHKPDCKTLEIADNDPTMTRDIEGERLAGLAPSLDFPYEVTEPGEPFTPIESFVAVARGIEESFARIADALQTIASRSSAPAIVMAPTAAPRAPRKPKAGPEAPPPSQEPTPAPEAAQAPSQEPQDGGADLFEDDPTPPPAPTKAAPPAKASPAAPPAPSADEVRTTFLGFASRKGRDAALQILSRFNAAKLGEIDAKLYPALMAALKEG